MKNPKKIYYTSVMIKTTIRVYGTIYWNQKYWIVPKWLVGKTIEKMRPERAILLDDLGYQKAIPVADYDFLVPKTIPINILHGHVPKETKVHVIMNPGVEYDKQKAI